MDQRAGKRRPPEEVSQGGASARGGAWLKTHRGRLALSPSTLRPCFIFSDLAFSPALDKTVPAHFYTVLYNVYLEIYCEDTGTQACAVLPWAIHRNPSAEARHREDPLSSSESAFCRFLSTKPEAA